MAKKKAKKSTRRRYKRRALRRAQDDELEEDMHFEISSETRRGIAVVLLFLLGVISALSFFGAAGPLGNGLADLMTKFFGWGDWLVPLILLILGYVILLPHRYSVHAINYVGLLLTILGLYGFLHVTQGPADLFSSLALGRGGGYVGLILSWPLIQIFGAIVAGVISFAVLLIGVFLTFNTSFELLYGEGNIFRRAYLTVRNYITHQRYASNGEEDEEDYEEAGVVDDDLGEGDLAEEGDEDVTLAATRQESGSDDELEEDEELSEADRQGELLQVPRRRMPKINLPLEILSGKLGKPTSGDIKANQQIIAHALEDFGIEVEMSEVNVGPTVTQYTFRPATGVKLASIMALQNDIALALAAHPIRIEAPIPGKSLVGIEVPNKAAATVPLKELLESAEFKKRTSQLTLTIGKDVAGKTYLADLKKMPHLLIAGATGSGKSVAINSILIGLMYQNQPSDLRFILVDPKRVELTSYADIPYLLTPVITDVKKTVSALRWAVSEMERRLTVLSHNGKRNIESYNKEADEALQMSYIIVVIDELADLMASSAAEVEGSIVRLAQMARAVGIHLIVATQRPSVDVLTGLIKANITSRIAFSVPSLVDSRTILDMSGAEKLLGRGDMLFVSAEVSKPKRLQGAFVSDKEIERFAQFLCGKAKPDYHDVDARRSAESGVDSLAGGEEDTDELLGEAKEVIRRAGKASASLLQRRLRIGYARAARILDILENLGYIGQAEGAKPREIYMDRFAEGDEYEESSDSPLDQRLSSDTGRQPTSDIVDARRRPEAALEDISEVYGEENEEDEDESDEEEIDEEGEEEEEDDVEDDAESKQ